MNWTHILRVFIVGWGILLVAVVINVLAQSLGVMTWYVWLKQVTGGTYALSVYDAVFFVVGVSTVVRSGRIWRLEDGSAVVFLLICS
ncbi:hypothetical protein LRY60_00485 [Candidatus Woesebacteria bacterium]|nr:hypothetical protein [Candidatus Woesebacteria bacterium]